MTLPRVMADNLPESWHRQLAGAVKLFPWEEASINGSIVSLK